jgi:GTP-binding protein
MQFIDRARIVIKSGDGGDGCAAFHREKYVQRGGPSGGDGGNGGDVVLVADPDSSTLLEFKYQRFYRAQRGEDGKAELCRGQDGDELRIKVPVGTVVRDVETGAVIADMNKAGKTRTLIKGGRGGKGNARFATPTRQAPRFAQPGLKTSEREVELELKTIADVGLIGMPNVGKSTLLAALTAARPKIANYHFTTLTPNLGVVQRYERSFVLADIPGLIEGAAEGAGLGHDFLRHIERTRMLVHVVDVSGSEGRDPLEDYETINAELCAYSEKLAALPQLVAANKTDIPGAEENLLALRAALEPRGVAVYPISAAGRQGLNELLDAVVKMLAQLPPVLEFEEEELELKPQYEPGFTVTREDDGAFVVSGGDVQRILDTTDPNDEASMRRFQMLLQKTGIIDALREAGAEDGSTVRMGEWAFDFIS